MQAIVLWIMKDAANPNVSYYVGTQSAVRMEATGTAGAKAGMILTASYTSPSTAKGRQHGEDTLIVLGR